MNKKQVDRRPGEKPADQGPDKRDPVEPEPGKWTPEGSQGPGNRGDHPVDKQAPKPGARSGHKEILDADRSDRESGRPIQLADDEDRAGNDGASHPSSGQRGDQADTARALGGRSQERHEDRKPYDVEKTRR